MASSTPFPTNWRLEGRDGLFPPLSAISDRRGFQARLQGWGGGLPASGEAPPPHPRFSLATALPSPLLCPRPSDGSSPHSPSFPRQPARSWTHPELGEVGIGGVVGLVVGIQQDGDDLLLLLRQLGPQTVPQGFLLLPLQDHLSLPLHLLICQDDCGARAGREGGFQEDWACSSSEKPSSSC